MFPYWTTKTFDERKVSNSVKETYHILLPYITSFLTSMHPFRNGRVCPYMHQALQEQGVFFTPAPHNASLKEYKELVNDMLLHYEDWRTDHEIFGCVILFFPQDTSSRMVKKIHRTVKYKIRKKGYMLGSFFPDSPDTGFHSTEWFPFRSPVPILVLRDMVPNDIIVAEDSQATSWSNLGFLRSYFRVMKSRKYAFDKNPHIQKAVAIQKKCRRRMAEYAILTVIAGLSAYFAL